ncbi:uncharacterized protein LOC126902894 [Daktulosphaira vitifoliae]|uniref:uncharacterized protein LOC126902894 n=1 Tax=Daktulosphaira vitifoliae TaxID=58002 RepID=UPI0021A9DCEB|nr:uncharacterized protein LOC126902894 [Daktulosphaira vitifoliae]
MTQRSNIFARLVTSMRNLLKKKPKTEISTPVSVIFMKHTSDSKSSEAQLTPESPPSIPSKVQVFMDKKENENETLELIFEKLTKTSDEVRTLKSEIIKLRKTVEYIINNDSKPKKRKDKKKPMNKKITEFVGLQQSGDIIPPAPPLHQSLMDELKCDVKLESVKPVIKVMEKPKTDDQESDQLVIDIRRAISIRRTRFTMSSSSSSSCNDDYD